ncbi:unnamed protein product [Darwinula stevensoni]|uniref:Uncharacterized protein n=1 Tax=Darwinula stevensoni TaxID=69355 RepID=A0A7R9ACP8_9CRUS|nr:unnamed protein product [Darwinula stevensoni]CAG0900019.1 unnamed protein product [Darwinula stevensoni]
MAKLEKKINSEMERSRGLEAKCRALKEEQNRQRRGGQQEDLHARVLQLYRKFVSGEGEGQDQGQDQGQGESEDEEQGGSQGDVLRNPIDALAWLESRVQTLTAVLDSAHPSLLRSLYQTREKEKEALRKQEIRRQLESFRARRTAKRLRSALKPRM